MKRKDRYPDTDTFHFHNQNPRNRYTGDCVHRALSLACDIPYNDVVMELAQLHCKTGYAKPFDKFLELHGFVKCKQPRKPDNKKYTGKEFCKGLQTKTFNDVTYEHRIVAKIGGNHIVAIIDGKVNDVWNSTCGCIGNYWVKR